MVLVWRIAWRTQEGSGIILQNCNLIGEFFFFFFWKLPAESICLWEIRHRYPKLNASECLVTFYCRMHILPKKMAVWLWNASRDKRSLLQDIHCKLIVFYAVMLRFHFLLDFAHGGEAVLHGLIFFLSFVLRQLVPLVWQYFKTVLEYLSASALWKIEIRIVSLFASLLSAVVDNGERNF